MIWLESITMALQQIRANRMRTFLTVLGIIIGIMTVVLIVSVLDGYQKSIEHEMNRMGANTFTLTRYEGGGFQVGDREYRPEFEYEYADMIRNQCDAVLHVGIKAVYWNGQVHGRSESTNPNVIVMGTNTDYPYVGGFNMDYGRFFNEVEVKNNRRVVVLGYDIVEKLFPHSQAVGQTVRIGLHKYKVIGIIEKLKSLVAGQSRNNLVLMPWTAFSELYGKGYDLSLVIQATSPTDMEKALAQTTILMRKVRHLKPGQKDNFHIVTSEGILETFGKVASKIQLGGISMGLISLLVGSIGVMAIMLVSVTERTREIGIRKAIGAKRGIILLQFLMESITLTTVGGILGILFGIGLSALVSTMFSIPMTVSVWAMVVSFVVTVILGLISGIYPAWKASSVDPIEALRYE